MDDQYLVNIVRGVEGQLLPRLVFRRDDLDYERRGRQPRSVRPRTVQGAVRHPEVRLGGAEVELVHRTFEARGAGQRPQQLGELLGYARVGEAGRGDHVQNTGPHLVEAREPGATTTLQEYVEAGRGGVQDQGAHGFHGTSEGQRWWGTPRMKHGRDGREYIEHMFAFRADEKLHNDHARYDNRVTSS